MDRLTHAEVGGPYASQDDARRAIQGGTFDQDPAELTVQEGSTDAGQKVAAWSPYQTPTTAPSPSPATPAVPELNAPVPDMSFPKTTKPAQTPGDGSSLPQSPGAEQFDPAPLQTPGPDPVAAATSSVLAMIRQSNPGMDHQAARRVAVRVAMRLNADFNPYAEMPNIEDPLADKTPLQVFHDVKKKTVPGRSRGRSPEPERPEEPQGDEGNEGEGSGGGDDGGDGGGGGQGDSGRLPFSRIPDLSEFDNRGAERAGAGAAGRAAMSRLPTLLV